jgi:NADH-quinone oxidoreductase subunit J
LELRPIIFYALSVIVVVPAIMIMVTRDIVRVAFWLLASLGGVAGLYLLLGADFVGVTQILVYIGGILVLILFGIMMTHRDPVLLSMQSQSRRSILSGILVSGLTFGALASVIFSTAFESTAGRSGGQPTTREIGRALLTDYILPFEIISVLLLVVLCGAAYVARREKEAPNA